DPIIAPISGVCLNVIVGLAGLGCQVAEEAEGQKSGIEAPSQGADLTAVASPRRGNRISILWRQLKDHRVVQWSAGYVAVAYSIQHAVTLTGEAYDWPNIVVRVSMTLLALGLPIAMTLAWYHGDEASRGFSRAEFSIVAALLIVGAFVFYIFVQP